MRWWPAKKQPRPNWAVAPGGERVLAAAGSRDGRRWLLGTRSALVVATADAPAVEWPWEQVQAADWDADERRLRISLIGTYGEQRPVSSFEVDDPTLLLQLLRERITASIVYQRHVPFAGRKGFRAIGRRSPAGGEITWMCDLDPGVEADTPGLAVAMEAALRQGRDELGT